MHSVPPMQTEFWGQFWLRHRSVSQFRPVNPDPQILELKCQIFKITFLDLFHIIYKLLVQHRTRDGKLDIFAESVKKAGVFDLNLHQSTIL